MKLYKLDNENKLFPFVDAFPRLADSVFVASGAKIIGDVESFEKCAAQID